MTGFAWGSLFLGGAVGVAMVVRWFLGRRAVLALHKKVSRPDEPQNPASDRLR